METSGEEPIDTPAHPTDVRRGRMLPWPDARPVVSWWGAAFPRAGLLLVVDPTVPGPDVPVVMGDVRGERDPRQQLLLTIPLSIVAGGAVLGGIAIYRATAWHWFGMALFILGAVLLPGAFGGWKRWHEARDHQRTLVGPAPVIVGSGLDEPLWNVVRHFNGNHQADEATMAAVRSLLAGLASTPAARRGELLAQLSDQFPDGPEHDAEEIRAATARIWAEAPDDLPGHRTWAELRQIYRDEVLAAQTPGRPPAAEQGRT